MRSNRPTSAAHILCKIAQNTHRSSGRFSSALCVEMNQKMLPKDAELYRRIEEVTHYLWDPIGVCNIPQARDEYHSYMTAIFSRVQAGNLEGILENMKWIASENMGLNFDAEKASEAAKVMLKWRDYINENT